MSNAALEKWTWVLIYGGLLLLCLGLFVRAGDAGLGWGLIVVGGLLAALGAALLVVRSRRAPDR